MNSLVETPSYPVPDFSPTGGPAAGDPSESSTQANLLAIAWRSRWLIVLCVALGGAVAWAVLERATPRYTSTSRIYVERSLPKLLNADMAAMHSTNYLNTQAEIIRSTSVLSSAVAQPEMQEIDTIRHAENPLGLLRKNLAVEVGQNDDIINISIELEDANDAAQVVNAVVDAYITEYAEQRRTDLVEVLDILRNEKIRRDEERDQTRQRLDDFRRQHAALGVQINDDNVVSQRFGTLASELNNTEIELLQAKARYDRVKKMYDTPNQQPFLLEMATANSTHLRDANLESQVRQAEQLLDNELARWGEGYPRVKLLKASLEDLKVRLAKQRANIVEGYVDALRQEYELLKHKRDELQLAYDEQFKLATDVSTQTLTLSGLQEDLVRSEEAADMIDERIKELNLSEEVGAMNVSVMEIAQPGYLSYPNRQKFLGMGVAFGALIGFGLAWLRDLLDHRLRSIDEIAEVMQLPIVGAIPQMAGEKSRQTAGQLVVHQPRSIAAEAVRTMRTGLHFGLDGADVKIVTVTSPSPGDGKSTVASNLAIAMSQTADRVLLIDADMRKPMQDTIFNIDSDFGLAAVLTEGRPPSEAIVPTGVGKLDLLPVGKLPANPVELLNNGYFGEMLNQLKNTYDKIVIDSPPVMPVADARVIAAMGDCTLLVLRAERATKRLSVAARDELWRVRAKRLAIAVNGVPSRRGGYGYGYGYGYGEYGTYGSYGDIAYGYEDEEKPARNGRDKRSSKKQPELPAMTD